MEDIREIKPSKVIPATSKLDGFPLLVSDVEPGSVNDRPAARHHMLGALYAFAAQGPPTLADLGHQGAGIGTITPLDDSGMIPTPGQNG